MCRHFKSIRIEDFTSMEVHEQTCGLHDANDTQVKPVGSLTWYFAAADTKRLPQSLYDAEWSRITQWASVYFVCCVFKCGAGIHVDEDPGAASTAPMDGVRVRQL